MSRVISEALFSNCVSVAVAAETIRSRPGYYAIFANQSKHVPSAVRKLTSSSNLLYVGIATRSLRKRLLDQELRQKSAATFFRSFGALLDYRPDEGSLRTRKNKRNFRFNREQTAVIVARIESCICVSWVEDSSPSECFEKSLICEHAPPFNIKHNPRPVHSLLEARAQCRAIACR